MFIGFKVARSFTLSDNPKAAKVKRGDIVGLYVCRDNANFGEICIYLRSGDDTWMPKNFAEFARYHLVLPKTCRISEFGDVFCAKQTIIVAAAPNIAGNSKIERKLKCCPICKGEIADSIRFPDSLIPRLDLALRLGLVH